MAKRGAQRWSRESKDGTTERYRETRTKQGEAHHVHLSAPARTIIADGSELTGGQPRQRRAHFPVCLLTLGVISDMSLTMLHAPVDDRARYMLTDLAGHVVLSIGTVTGFRSALSSFGYKRQLCRRCGRSRARSSRNGSRQARLSSANNSSKSARELLDAWGAFVTGAASADVVAIP